MNGVMLNYFHATLKSAYMRKLLGQPQPLWTPHGYGFVWVWRRLRVYLAVVWVVTVGFLAVAGLEAILSRMDEKMDRLIAVSSRIEAKLDELSRRLQAPQ